MIRYLKIIQPLLKPRLLLGMWSKVAVSVQDRSDHWSDFALLNRLFLPSDNWFGCKFESIAAVFKVSEKPKGYSQQITDFRKSVSHR